MRCVAWAGAAVLAAGVAAAAPGAGTPEDPLARELARWTAFLASGAATGDTWKSAKDTAEPVVASARRELAQGRRLLALSRYAAVQDYLRAAEYVSARPVEQHRDLAAFEKEWVRVGTLLAPDLAPLPSGTFEGLRPAAVRALAEASRPRVRAYYEASLHYGKSTMADAGLFYLGTAQAQGAFPAFLRGLSEPAAGAALVLRALGPEIEELQSEILAAYRPPASIDNHRDFILANSALKEARELDRAGLRHGALFRYLEAALRFGPLRAGGVPTPASLEEPLAALAARLGEERRDHTIARVYLEAARSDLEEHAKDAAAPRAAAIVADVLPRYLAALAPPKVRAAPAEPKTTVTLVRWPFT